MRAELRGQFGVGGLNAGAELVGREDRQVQLDLFIALPVLGFDVGVRDAHPPGDRGLDLLGEQRAAELILELDGPQRRPLHVQDLAIRDVADELAVLLEARHADDALTQLGVAHADARAAWLRPPRLPGRPSAG